MKKMVCRRSSHSKTTRADDSSWKFIDQKSVLIKKGYQPPIHDFSITTTDGENITDRILDQSGIYASHDICKT